ncbi:MAG: ribosomal RNA small subunit methyltransferase A [Planctomycetes bacterium]|nr:ribosomal RNA small subunit methyltransferase A [Planctomycetota bacterium]
MGLTKTSLVSLLKDKGIVTSKRLGQNFLIDRNFLKYIVRTAGVSKGDTVLEIGSGPGLLTELLAEKAKMVYAVEIDRKLYQLSQELFGHIKNLKFINADILSHRLHRLNPEIINLIGKTPIKVVSNLPYKVAVPIIMGLLESNLEGRIKLQSATVMVQSEVAVRLAARTGCSEYSAVSVLCQMLADIKILKKIPPEVFYPRPHIYSTLVSITPIGWGRWPNSVSVIANPDTKCQDEAISNQYQRFKKLVQGVFTYRRKTIRTALEKSGQSNLINRLAQAGSPADLPDKALAQAGALAKAGISGRQRPQEISIESYLKLETFYKQCQI